MAVHRLVYVTKSSKVNKTQRCFLKVRVVWVFYSSEREREREGNKSQEANKAKRG